MVPMSASSRRSSLGLVAAFFMLAGCAEKKELSIESVSPSRGDFRGGTTVVIEGSGFSTTAQGMSVYFGKGQKGRNPVIHSNTKIAVEAPGGPMGETVDVEVIFDDSRSARLTNAYTYFDPAPANVGDMTGDKKPAE